jgi:hypothetical protein
MLKNYSLSITLATLFLITWLGQGYFQWVEFQNTQKEHNQPVTTEDFIPEFFSKTLENWQSEFLQLLAFVVLTSFLIHKGSPESRDGQDRMEKKIDRIEKILSRK